MCSAGKCFFEDEETTRGMRWEKEESDERVCVGASERMIGMRTPCVLGLCYRNVLPRRTKRSIQCGRSTFDMTGQMTGQVAGQSGQTQIIIGLCPLTLCPFVSCFLVVTLFFTPLLPVLCRFWLASDRTWSCGTGLLQREDVLTRQHFVPAQWALKP